MMKFSPQDAPEVVIVAIYSAANDENLVKMTTF